MWSAPRVFTRESQAGSGVQVTAEEGLSVGSYKREACALHTPCTFFPHRTELLKGRGLDPSSSTVLQKLSDTSPQCGDQR